MTISSWSNGQQLERLDTLIAHLIELRDLLDGDVELDEELHDGAALFPNHPAYGPSRYAPGERGPGDPEDAEEGEADEDSDADEWSGIIVYDERGRWRSTGSPRHRPSALRHIVCAIARSKGARASGSERDRR